MAAPAFDRLPCADVGIEDDAFHLRRPASCYCTSWALPLDALPHLVGNRRLTGDALLTEGCGRTDFPIGDADALSTSATEKLFGLPDEIRVYPAHDYQGRGVSFIAQEKPTQSPARPAAHVVFPVGPAWGSA